MFAILLITATASLVCLIVIIIALVWRLKSKSSKAVNSFTLPIGPIHIEPTTISPIVDSTVVIDARPSFGEEEKDTYIEMFEQMV